MDNDIAKLPAIICRIVVVAVEISDMTPNNPTLESVRVVEICEIVFKVEEDGMAEILSEEWLVDLLCNFSASELTWSIAGHSARHLT
jgi:hypothetical protein